MEDKVEEDFKEYWPTSTVRPSITCTILSYCTRSCWNECCVLCWGCRYATPEFECWRYMLWRTRHRSKFPSGLSPVTIYDIRYGACCKECVEPMSSGRTRLERESKLMKNVKNGLRRSVLGFLLLLEQQLMTRTNSLVKILNDHSMRKKCAI